jgi:steroid delta-isomerase-like uncharacterized protein
MGQNASIAQRQYELWNERDFDGIASLFADDAEIVLVGSGASFTGSDGARQFAHMWADAFPNGKVTITKTIESSDDVVVEFTGTGTQTGTLASPAGEIPPTGKSVTIELCDVIAIRDGKIASVRSYLDSASLLAQLGVTPQTQPTTA